MQSSKSFAQRDIENVLHQDRLAGYCSAYTGFEEGEAGVHEHNKRFTDNCPRRSHRSGNLRNRAQLACHVISAVCIGIKAVEHHLGIELARFLHVGAEALKPLLHIFEREFQLRFLRGMLLRVLD